jgi:hypothetical protein
MRPQHRQRPLNRTNGENMPDVASLTSEVNRLTESLGFWNTAIIVMLVFTTMAAAGLVITQRIAFKRADSLADATGRLSQLKEQKSGEKIADALRRAAEAERFAAENQKETAILTAQNLRLEAAISPRRLTAKQLKELADIKSNGRTLEIKSYTSDVEGLVVATQIVDVLRSNARLLDNRSTMQPVRAIVFGITVTGADSALVEEITAILGNFIEKSRPPNRDNFTISNSSGTLVSRVPPAAIITVGVKPIK